MADTPTVEALLAEWIAAFNAHDLDRHMRLYTQDAILFGSVDELKVGRPAIRAYFAARPPTVRVRRYPIPLVRDLAPDVKITGRPGLYTRKAAATSKPDTSDITMSVSRRSKAPACSRARSTPSSPVVASTTS